MNQIAKVSSASHTNKIVSQREKPSVDSNGIKYQHATGTAGKVSHFNTIVIGRSATMTLKRSIPLEELRKLMNGQVIQIFVGEPGREYIAVESAYAKLLCFYSLYCSRMLSSPGINRIFIPSGTKASINFIYRYMTSGGNMATITDSKGLKFRDLKVPDLLVLYGHSKYLEIPSLKETVIRQIQWKLSRVFLLVDQIDYALRNVPEIKNAVVSTTARLFLLPKVLDYEPWIQYNALNASFGEDVEKAISVRLREASARRRMTSKRKELDLGSRREQSSPECHYNASQANDRVSEAVNESSPKGTRPRARLRTIGRNKNRRHAETLVQRAAEVHLDEPHTRANPVKKDSTQISPQLKRKELNVRRPSGQPKRQRNRFQGESRRNAARKIVEVVSNGEGITTSYREIRQGEVTRLGLVV